jgi:hypothetical protein
MNNKNTLFVFDWDDTLFPTNWYMSNGIKASQEVDAGKYALYFIELDTYMYRLLKLATELGTVLIVTNATREWVVISTTLLPRSAKLISSSIPIVSARDLYQNVYDMPYWKLRTFHNDISRYIKNANQVITIGDSDFEHRALASLNNPQIPRKNLKAIRFVKSPAYDILIDQLSTLTKSLNDICKQRGHLDLNFNVPSMMVNGVAPTLTGISDNDMFAETRGTVQGYGSSLLNGRPLDSSDYDIDWIPRS